MSSEPQLPEEASLLDYLLDRKDTEGIDADHFCGIKQGSEDWHRLRNEVLELTGSEFAAAVGADEGKSRASLYYRKIGGESPTPSPYLEMMLAYGRDNEPVALEEARVLLPMLTNAKNIEETGTWVFLDVRCRLGSTPDGIITSSTSCHQAILEIKCPFKAPPYQSLKEPRPYIKNSHYIQVQMEMMATSTDVGFYYVWTPEESILAKVKAAPMFQADVLQKAEDFILDHVRPKLPPKRAVAGLKDDWTYKVKRSCDSCIQEIWVLAKGDPGYTPPDEWSVSRIYENAGVYKENNAKMYEIDHFNKT